MAGIAGKDGSLTIGSNEYSITNWEITPKAELLEDSSSTTEGRETWVKGFTGATGSFTSYYDPDSSPMAVIQPGDEVTLILGFNGSKNLTVPAIISDLPFTIPIKGKIEFTCNFTANNWTMNSSISGL
jgi:hypothetical protein